MKKRGLLILTVLALLLGMAACGGAGGDASSAESSAASSAEAPAAGQSSADYDNGWAEDDMAAADAAEAGGADFSAVRANAKLILSADLSLETQEFDRTCAELERMTAEAGGYIESNGTSGEAGGRYANYTLRVPQAKFEDCFAKIGETCHVVSSNRWSEDVTEQYTDIEIHLATLETKHERLLALLDKASQMEDIIALENALADCEYQIDSLSGEKRRYDSLVDFSTISVSVRETQSLTAVSAGSGFGAQLTKAAKSGFGGLTGAVRGLVLLVVTLWPLVLILCAAGFFTLRALRRRKARKKETPPAERAEE